MDTCFSAATSQTMHWCFTPTQARFKLLRKDSSTWSNLHPRDPSQWRNLLPRDSSQWSNLLPRSDSIILLPRDRNNLLPRSESKNLLPRSDSNILLPTSNSNSLLLTNLATNPDNRLPRILNMLLPGDPKNGLLPRIAFSRSEPESESKEVFVWSFEIFVWPFFADLSRGTSSPALLTWLLNPGTVLVKAAPNHLQPWNSRDAYQKWKASLRQCPSGSPSPLLHNTQHFLDMVDWLWQQFCRQQFLWCGSKGVQMHRITLQLPIWCGGQTPSRTPSSLRRKCFWQSWQSASARLLQLKFGMLQKYRCNADTQIDLPNLRKSSLHHQFAVRWIDGCSQLGIRMWQLDSSINTHSDLD